MTETERAALDAFVAGVRAHYGARLHGVLVFGSRARGDHTPASDVDVAIILADGDWEFWDERMRLVDQTLDALLDAGLLIQPWPFSKRSWLEPTRHSNPRLVAAARRDARPVVDAA